LVAGIPKSLPLLALSAELESSQGSKPQSYAYTAYDGLWMVALATLDSDWSSSASTLGTQFATTSKGYTGLSNALTLNSNGDRKLGNYDFLTPSAGNWSTIYTYYDNPATGVGKLISH
jgi:ABC-type branched-subunit amino acid transport system substrate-binding protein